MLRTITNIIKGYFEVSINRNEELMKYFRSEYKSDANNAYDYWMSTRKTNYRG